MFFAKGFCEAGGKIPQSKDENQPKNSTLVWRQHGESNPGHIAGSLRSKRFSGIVCVCRFLIAKQCVCGEGGGGGGEGGVGSGESVRHRKNNNKDLESRD